MTWSVASRCRCHGWTYLDLDRSFRTRLFARLWRGTMQKTNRRRGGVTFDYEVQRD